MAEKDSPVRKQVKGFDDRSENSAEKISADSTVSNREVCGQSSPPFVESSMNLQKKEKICLVCGDKALGYNFNAVSCESCKAFFRRNAHKTIRGRCEGQCDVTVESRSFCKKCRLAKCFFVGMRKDMILNDEQKQVRKQKIIINKLRKHGQLPPEDTYSASPSDLDVSFQDTLRTQSLKNLRAEFPNLSEKDLLVLQKLKEEKRNSSLGLSERGEKEQSYPSWSESKENEYFAGMSEIDQCIVNELCSAHEQSSFLANTQTQLKTNPANPTEFINIAEGFVRRIIKVAKNIEFFKMICKEDQIALLKGSVVEIMMLRSAINYDIQTETWSLSTKMCLSKNNDTPSVSDTSEASSLSSLSSTTSNPFSSMMGNLPAGLNANDLRAMGQAAGISREEGLARLRSMMGQGNEKKDHGEVNKISADILKLGDSETQNMFLTYSKFIKSLMRTIHGDLLILKLLVMMSLFSADRQGILEHDKVQAIQECYAGILQKYVAKRFPEDKTLFAKIVMKLTDLRNINEVHTKMLLKMQVSNIEPLLVEIFDLPS